jgi:hypothetical protein
MVVFFAAQDRKEEKRRSKRLRESRSNNNNREREGLTLLCKGVRERSEGGKMEGGRGKGEELERVRAFGLAFPPLGISLSLLVLFRMPTQTNIAREDRRKTKGEEKTKKIKEKQHCARKTP